MIPHEDLRTLAEERLRDAEALLDAGRYDGAVYLGGYVVELAIKSRICHALGWTGFPQTRAEFQNYTSFKTHNLDVLLRLCAREQQIKAEYFAEWSAITTWDPEARYNPIGTATEPAARLLVESARTLLGAL